MERILTVAYKTSDGEVFLDITDGKHHERSSLIDRCNKDVIITLNYILDYAGHINIERELYNKKYRDDLISIFTTVISAIQLLDEKLEELERQYDEYRNQDDVDKEKAE